MFPSARGHRVVIVDFFAADLIPLWALGVEVVHVEAVIVSAHNSLTGSVETSAVEFFDFFVLGVVKAVKAIAGRVVERNATIVACRQNVRAPG